MNHCCLRVGALVLALFFAADVFAQDQPAPFLRLDFMKSTNDDYVSMESEIWKPLHQDAVNMGEMLAWNLFWVNYGDRTKYDYVTVNVYADREAMEGDFDEWVNEAFARVHPDADVDKAMSRTSASRENVKSELWREVLREGPPGPYQYAAINYMKVPPGGGQAYVDLERDWWAPIHRAAIAKGCEGGWAVYQLLNPFGTQLPYNYAAVNFRNAWKGGCSYQDMAAEVHPETSWETIGEATSAAREGVYGIEWMLIDTTTGRPADN